MPPRGDGRYTVGNAYLRQLLDVTPAEQRHLLTVIGPEEKARRRRERNGSVERAEYLRAAQAATPEIRAVAARLKAQGETSPAIARVLGVTTRHVNRLLKGCMPEQWDMVGPLYSSVGDA
ncbi:MAG: helix-turn-helix domain-containing protein, partial [Planctomyces sp.]